MPVFSETNAHCWIFTYKEGVLSAVAHDLKLEVTKFEIRVEGSAVEAEFDARSIRVATPMRNGEEAPQLLGRHYFPKIEDNVASDVLHVRRHPTVRFRGTASPGPGEGVTLEGTLELHGTERPLRALAHPRGEFLETEVAVDQPAFGIKPYSAMMGTLKVKPVVQVRIRVPREP